MRNPVIIGAVAVLVLATSGLIIKGKINESVNTQILGEGQEVQIILHSATPTVTSTPNNEQWGLEIGKEKTEIESKPNQYAYDSYYPIILSLSDNKGGTIKHSEYNQYSYGSSITGITLKVGDTIRWKAETSDPKNRQVLYCFHSNSQRFTDLFGRENGQYKYTASNEIEFTITEDDIKEVGEAFSVVLYIRSEKESYRTGSDGYDDVAYLDYKLSR